MRGRVAGDGVMEDGRDDQCEVGDEDFAFDNWRATQE
jgi:hypothetical protein